MQLIEHRTHGKGRILNKRFGGFELYVEFEDGIKRWARRDQVRFLSEAPILIKYEPPKAMLSDKQFRARQIIEALRLGVVPYDYVEEFTFGREDEIKYIKKQIDKQDRCSLIISGEYGVGKTHLLEYIYSFALKNNWAVSLVELDPNEVSFCKPKVIYEKIIHSLKFKSRNGDFRELLRQVAVSPKFHKLNEHKYLSKIIEEIRGGTDNEDIWEWIEGKPSQHCKPLMYPYSTCANIYCYILSGIDWAIKNILGMNGFLILFDEAESVDSYWYSSYQNNKAWNFLTGLVLMANNDERLLQEVNKKRLYEHEIYSGWWGYYSHLQYCGYSQLPFVWKTPCNIKLIFGFSPIQDQEIFAREPLKDIDTFELEYLSTESLEKISRKILGFYEQAYNFQTDIDSFISILEDKIQGKTRLFIKGLIETLDLMRFHPDKAAEELLNGL
ncbi:MAG: DUF2791 family P-loop domain-containing protein [Candidatus Cloacimonetes bacterium]|nr:DUF2791 family P-loop domain-containing protein [Candidatus Cloacimonadota bacterium]